MSKSNTCLCGYSFLNPSVKHYCELVAEVKKASFESAGSLPAVSRAPFLTRVVTESQMEEVSSELLEVGKEENIKVIVRVRPILKQEVDRGTGDSKVISLNPPDGKSVTVSGSEARHKLKVKFDAAFGDSSTQEEVYSDIKECADAVVDGFNTTVFAYGQTGTGKTHTMFGPPGHIQNISVGGKLHRSSGIIPRAIMDIFDKLACSTEGKSCAVFCSFVQVYNEQLFDMLRDGNRMKALDLREGRDGVYVQGLSEYSVGGFADCLDLLRLGEENRMVRETHMNVSSSRSHSIFTVFVEQEIKKNDSSVTIRSKFNLVDLAGSEKWDLNQNMVDERVSEMTNINLSLYTLGRCIAALSSSKSDLSHVPYRDSKLTRLLQDSLGGNAKTRVIATLSPAADCVDESISTLRFADRAKQVMVFLRKNEDVTVDPKMVEKMQREIIRLRALVQQMSSSGIPPPLTTLPRISDVNTSPLVSPRKGKSPNDELEKLKIENASLRASLNKLPVLSSVEGMHSQEEFELLKDTASTLFLSLESVIQVANQFFSFEIEEEDLKGAIDQAALPGIESMSKYKFFLSKQHVAASKKTKISSDEYSRTSVLKERKHQMNKSVRESVSLVPIARVDITSSETENSWVEPNGEKPFNQQEHQKNGNDEVRQVVYTNFNDPPRSVARFRVRGKAGSVETVDEAADEEARLSSQLAKAKARMIKHKKLQAWLKAKEEKELALLEMEEAEEREEQLREAKKEKNRQLQARKSKDKLRSFYKSLEDTSQNVSCFPGTRDTGADVSEEELEEEEEEEEREGRSHTT